MAELNHATEPDLIIHSGDVFDGLRPATADLRLALGALNDLGAIAPTVVLAGNHDSGALFEVFAMLLGPSSRVRFVSKARAGFDGGSSRCPPATAARLQLAGAVLRCESAGQLVQEPGDMAVYATRMQLIDDILREGLEDGFDPARDVLLTASPPSAAPLLTPTARARRRDVRHRVRRASIISSRRARHPASAARAADALCRLRSAAGLRRGGGGEVLDCRRAAPRPPAEVGLRSAAGGPCSASAGGFEQIAARSLRVGASCCTRIVVEQTARRPRRRARRRPGATFVEVDERIASRTLTALDPSGADDEAPEPTYLELLELYLQGTVTGDKTVPAAEVQALFAALHDSLYDDGDPPLEQLAKIIDAALPTPQEPA